MWGEAPAKPTSSAAAARSSPLEYRVDMSLSAPAGIGAGSSCRRWLAGHSLKGLQMSKTPKPASETEREWFAKNEREMLVKAQKEREERLQQREAEESTKALKVLKAAHWLKCPKCGHDMEVENIEGIEIEECTFCEGVYFDRGELDTLMMRRTEQRFKFVRSIFKLK
jgi:uncharacterized protein